MNPLIEVVIKYELEGVVHEINNRFGSPESAHEWIENVYGNAYAEVAEEEMKKLDQEDTGDDKHANLNENKHE